MVISSISRGENYEKLRKMHVKPFDFELDKRKPKKTLLLSIDIKIN